VIDKIDSRSGDSITTQHSKYPRHLTMICQSSVSLFVVINPVGSIALVISMTSIMDASERNVVLENIIITTAALLTEFGVNDESQIPDIDVLSNGTSISMIIGRGWN
jgi:hypothetical protein